MIAPTTATFIALALGCLVLNWFALRAEMTHGGLPRILRYGAIWFGIIAGLSLLLTWSGVHWN